MRPLLNGIFQAGIVAAGLLLPFFVRADPPSPFAADYIARYGGFRASAERTLQITAGDRIEMSTSMALKLFGQTLSGITELSTLETDGDSFRPLDYSFTQTGLGKRRREIHFDWENASALATVDDNTTEIPLESPMLDNLSAYLEIGRQLREGKREIVFDVIDKGKVEESRFRVLDEETLDTNIGDLRTLKLEKVRGEDSDRHTEVWLARDWDYLLVKLVQEEPGSRRIRLDLKAATVGNTRVEGLADDSSAAD